MKTKLLFTLGLLISATTSATTYPLTVKSCEREVIFNQSPQRAVSNDINLTEMMVALDLQNKMIGYTSVSSNKNPDKGLINQLKTVPELSPRYPTLELLLDAQADFLFAGWNYGMRVGGDVTPTTLAPLGIAVYELTESCSHIMTRERPSFDDLFNQLNNLSNAVKRASLDDLFNDLNNLGRIFDAEERATTVIDELKTRLIKVKQQLPDNPSPLRVFLYDSGNDRPFTSGRLGMPQALFDFIGVESITQYVNASWTRISWETVVELEPDVIVIVDYGSQTAEQKKDFLLHHPALQKLPAITNQRFIILPYNYVTPGIHNVTAIEILSRSLFNQDKS